jgi:hypothetical protein
MQPYLTGDHDAVEHLGERLAVVAAAAPRVRDQAGLDARALGRLDRLDHRFVRTHPGEEPVHELLRVRQAEHRAEPLGEVLLGQLAALEPAQLGQRAWVLAEESLHRIRVEPLLLAERLERVEDVRRQYAAEVDQQALHEREI